MPAPFDVIITGGGIIGASIAWRLARDNRRVLLLDAGKIGGEASSAAAGMLSPGGEFDDPAMLDFAMTSFAQYPDFIRCLEQDSGLPIEFRLTSAVEILANGSSKTFKNEAIVDPAALMRALRAACLARGGIIEEDSPVASIAVTENCVRVSRFSSRFAVLAAGAWSSDIAITIGNQPYPIPRAYPVKGHLLGYRLPPRSLDVTVRQGHTYVFQRADGFTIAGSTTEDAGFDRTIDPNRVADLAARAGALVPALRGLTPESAWIGFRPGIDSPGPQIGRVLSSRLWLAYGHYRNGILLAPATSARISQEIGAALE